MIKLELAGKRTAKTLQATSKLKTMSTKLLQPLDSYNEEYTQCREDDTVF